MGEINRQLSSVKHEVENLQNVAEPGLKWDDFVKELKTQWRAMWRERIAKDDYSLLLLECGTIVVATRKYRAPDFLEILEHHRKRLDTESTIGYVNPSVGGWRKFINSTLSRQQRFARRPRPEPLKSGGKSTLQKKKGGRGWVHQF
jgi:hypothetical protein